MRAHQLPARQGLAWIAQGFALYRRNPVALAGNVLLASLFMVFPGQFVLPLFTVGLLNSCRSVDQGVPPSLGMVFSGIRPYGRPLLLLGVFFYAISLLAFLLTSAFDGGMLAHTMGTIKNFDDPALRDPAVLRSLLFQFAVFAPLMLFASFAPVIAGWRGIPPFKALFFSFFACWRNLAPLLVCLLGLFGLFVLIPPTLATAVALVSPALGALVMLVGMLAFLPLCWSCFYVATRAIFPELWDAPAT